jgi:hypothetical protein
MGFYMGVGVQDLADEVCGVGCPLMAITCHRGRAGEKERMKGRGIGRQLRW